jgi:transcriptional regulator of acetoin/glycerol metabolism
MEALCAHDWPGNIRELENVLQRALIVSRGGTLSLSEAWQPALETVMTGNSATLVDVERRHIVRVLDEVRWRIEGGGGAAQVLGMKPSTLRSRMLKLGVSRPR